MKGKVCKGRERVMGERRENPEVVKIRFVVMDRRDKRRSVRVKPTCCAIPSMKTKITITKRIPVLYFNMPLPH